MLPQSRNNTVNPHGLLAYCLMILLLLTGQHLAAQKAGYVEGELLVQLPPTVDGKTWAAAWAENDRNAPMLEAVECVSPPLNVWLFQFDPYTTEPLRLLTSVRSRKEVLAAQFNHLVDLRSTLPDDPLIANQWQYLNTGQTNGLPDADIDADLAWDVATGGLTITGDTIVICVIDDGLSLSHPDFQQNRWINHAEIPANGIDDDQNGYVDDYLGWSTVTNDDQIGSGGSHGTPVVGIIGADGNNGVGVSGLNWRVKVMVIKNNFNTTEAKVLAAYSYPLAQRMRYNASQGTAGAFVVATNASWGVNGGMPDDSPIWCALYDSLGTQGILNCGATANQNVNVDVSGDLPTTCPSPFLIAVTNTNHLDEKVPSAGFGAVNIDLGAPGSGSYTITSSGSYGVFGGTSAATPHVTGTIGLLYSAPCPSLMTLVRSDPAAAALWIREVILGGVDTLSALTNLTATGGRLNVFNSLQLLLEDCGSCLPPSSNQVIARSDVQASVAWNTNDSLQRVAIRWRPASSPAWLQADDAQSPFLITGLQACTQYEYQLAGFCQSETTGFGSSFFFTTDGCCVAPDNIILDAVGQEQATIFWSSVLAATTYEIRWRPEGDDQWSTSTTLSQSVLLTNLETCTDYEYQVGVRCNSGQLIFSPLKTFSTAGCGPCLDRPYCISEEFNNSGEWIRRVAIGSFFENISGAEPDGYSNYGLSLDPLPLMRGIPYPLALEPAFSGISYLEAFSIWVDLDQNGFFTSQEKVFSGESSSQLTIGNLLIPASALPGLTRMRVVMQFLSASDPCPFQSVYGETEDYCVYLLDDNECPSPIGFRLSNTDTTQLTVRWNSQPGVTDYLLAYRQRATANWSTVVVQDTFFLLDALQACTEYVLQLSTNCDTTIGAIRPTLDALTACVNSVDNPTADSPHWVVYPNPGISASLAWLAGTDRPALRISIFDVLGRPISRQLWPAGTADEVFLLPAADWPPGLYFILIEGEKEGLSGRISWLKQ